MRDLLLATRNLFRNTRRTALTIAAIAVGLGLMLWTVNFQHGAYGEMISSGVSTQAGHVVVQAQGYQEEREATMVVRDVEGVVATARAVAPDAVITPRVWLGGLVTSPSNSAGGALVGMWPKAEEQILDAHERVVEGEWLGEDDREIVIGVDMAEALDVTLGDKLVYMGQSGTDDVQARLFRVRGIYRTGIAQVDSRLAYVHLAAAQELLGGGDVAHMVAIHLDDPDRALEDAPRLAAALGRPELDVRHWRDAMPDLIAMVQVYEVMGDVMLAILGIIAAFGVLNTLLMSALERTREFGVMLALGLKPGRIAQVVMLEGVVLGVFGAMAGLVVSLPFSWYTAVYGLDYAAFGMGETMEMEGLVLDSLMMGSWDPTRMVVYTVAAVFFCFIASLYPAWTISKLRPVQALRHH